jgi:putative SOS response-associated peptidase YedK
MLDFGELGSVPRFNIAPSQDILTIFQLAGKTSCEFLKWGYIPSWAKDLKTLKPMINARIETIAEKPFFKSALKTRRCLIPADGFFEWKIDAVTGQKIQTYIYPSDKRLFAFAGLWDQWVSPDGEVLRTCSIITMPANSYMDAIHHRMPAILPVELEQSWLNSEETDVAKAMSLLAAAGNQSLMSHQVSRAVNSTRTDSSECIVEYIEPEAKLV